MDADAIFKVDRKIVVGIVYMVLLLDSFLMTALHPILPKVLGNFLAIGSDDNQDNISPNGTKFINGSYRLDNDGKNVSKIFNKDAQSETYGDMAKMIGFLVSLKSITQLVSNLIVGPMISRIGHTVPLLFSSFALVASALTTSISGCYELLLVAMVLHGLGSASCNTAGFSLLAKRFSQCGDDQRSNAVSFTMGAPILGALLGATVSGAMYFALGGKALTFLIIGLLALLCSALQIKFLRPKLTRETTKDDGWWRLLLDPYIALATFSIFIVCSSLVVNQIALPLHMSQTLNASPAEIGMVLSTSAIACLISVHTMGPISYRFGRWLTAIFAVFIAGMGLCMIPLVTNVYYLQVINIFIGFCAGLFDTSILPEFAKLIDLRHPKAYGNIYALSSCAFCLAFTIGPLMGAASIDKFGFDTTMYIYGSMIILYCPTFIFLRNPSGK